MVKFFFSYIAFILFIITQITGLIKGYSLNFILLKGFTIYAGVMITGMVFNKSLQYLGIKEKTSPPLQAKDEQSPPEGSSGLKSEGSRGNGDQNTDKVKEGDREYVKNLQKELGRRPDKVAAAIDKMVKE
ncbi:MAG: hypothetical protein GF375_04275 [Candidatus Omnitrophica bacterium]|nr:hypothetical protein [Candidatus Omnitrophota bacterium]MBD3269261.1 hypothetical protein [Candidatus Omnitrophota bacterium]